MKTIPPTPPTGELVPLTSLRGLAAWWVVLFHMRALLAPWLPAPVLTFLGAGNLAVDLFFLLSGFVIYLNYAERLTSRRVSTREFLFRRFARIYPLHLLILLAFLAYVSAALLFGSARIEEENFDYFLASLFLVQNWGFTDALKWNVPAWSISTEFGAYLLFPALLAMLAPWRRPAWLLVATTIALGVAVHAIFALFALPYPDAVAQTGLIRCLLQFAMGMLVCELYQRLAGQSRLAMPLLALAGTLAGLHILAGAPVVPLVWASLILGLALARNRVLEWAPLLWLGNISYATYLCHYIAIKIFKLLFVAEGETVGLLPLLALTAAILTLSAVLYHGFERPAQRWLNLAWDRRRAPRHWASAG
ncbi:acyltransferase family protein [Sphingosinicella rhizophila]|uniref:Acyltransferase n=1 Tax=Sphingosinicella rhizophila TaxID=3050082 RepID=A0ABU3Q575_9SPHN|nr:acyltransferase [Sphingosinicella sp. GR2756]MDT9598442.1 acyltransferase [Sphingosinicella sp. GR2756]